MQTKGTETAPPVLTSIQTALTFTPEQLVRDHFIKGSCQNVDNITSLGSEVSIGYFTNGGDAIGLGTGIIISTGDIADAAGPNDDVATSTSFNNTAGDPDLNLFATNVVQDATGIEFDFVPLGHQVTFKYVFASEEYCEYVGSIFNDNFGFFVSGPGIAGEFSDDAINVARLPNTGEYVTINNVNHEKNSASYVKNELEDDTDQCGTVYGPNHLMDIEYDGFTIPLTATIPVVPCQTYHIRLVVGDVGDDKLDSAIFLEAKSFDLGSPVEVIARAVDSDEPIAYEGCRDGLFIFRRGNNQQITEPLQVDFTISPISMAVADVDYVSLPTSITIPANQLTAQLPVEVLPDGVSEAPELLRLDVVYACACQPAAQADLYLVDPDSLQGSFTEIFVCPDQSFTVGPTVSGGVPPYTYLWNTGATTRLLTETVTEPTHFTVTITDDCDHTSLAIAGVGIQEDPVAVLSDSVRLCDGDTGFLTVLFTGNPPWSVRYTIDGVVQPALEEIYSNPFALPVTEPGEYLLTAFTDAFCEGIPTGSGWVQTGSIVVNYAVTAPSCPGLADGSIRLTWPDAPPDVTIAWNVAVTDVWAPADLAAGDYTVSITDAMGCTQATTIPVPESTDFSDACLGPLVYVPNAFSPNGDGVNDYFTAAIPAQAPVARIISGRLFDRWGDAMAVVGPLPTAPSVRIWDGMTRQRPATHGVYVWVLTLELSNGTQRVLTGDVLLVR